MKTNLLFVLMMLPLVASGADVEIDDIFYKLNSEAKTAEVTSANKSSETLVILKSIESKGMTYSVTSIGERAFSSCSNLTSITIPSSVTSIGKSAFQFCENLTSINITDLEAWCKITFHSSPESPYHLFLNGQEIKDLVIPNSVTSIGDGAFNRCCGLTSVTIPNSVTSIGWSAFMYCTGLTSLTIPNSVTTIGGEAFEDCHSLTSVIIGNGVTTIYGEAFKDCKNLTSVIIGSSITNIDGRSFGKCEKLSDVYCYAETVPTTDSYAFYKTSIENATLHVPAASVDSYKETAPWSGFGSKVALNGTIEPVIIPKCETPTISFVDGKLTFTCNTDDVEFISQITASDAKNYYDSSIALTKKYTVSVYASKEGYENSETVTKEFSFGGNSGEISDVFGDINGDGVVDVADVTALVNIIMSTPVP